MRKGKVILVAVLLVFSIVFAGCGQTDQHQQPTVQHKITKLTFYATVACGDECAKIISEMQKTYPVEFVETNYLAENSTTGIEALRNVVHALFTAQESEKLSYPFIVVWVDNKPAALIVGVKEPNKIIEIAKKALNSSPFVYFDGHEKTIVMEQWKEATTIFEKVKGTTWKNAVESNKWLVGNVKIQGNATCSAISDGLIVFGTNHCPYTRAIVHYAEKKFNVCFIDVSSSTESAKSLLDVQKVIGNQSGGIPTTIMLKKDKPQAAWIGFLPLEIIESIYTATQPIIVNGQDVNIMSATQSAALMDIVNNLQTTATK